MAAVCSNAVMAQCVHVVCLITCVVRTFWNLGRLGIHKRSWSQAGEKTLTALCELRSQFTCITHSYVDYVTSRYHTHDVPAFSACPSISNESTL